MSREVRIEKLKRMLRARTGPDGNALPNYAENVAALKAAIAKHEARIA